MSEQSERWSEVGTRLEGLASRLKLHYEQTGRSAEMPDAMARLRHAVTEAFEATGSAVRDEGVRADVRDTGRLLIDAMSATLAKVSGDLKEKADTMKERESRPSGTGAAGPADAPPASEPTVPLSGASTQPAAPEAPTAPLSSPTPPPAAD